MADKFIDKLTSIKPIPERSNYVLDPAAKIKKKKKKKVAKKTMRKISDSVKINQSAPKRIEKPIIVTAEKSKKVPVEVRDKPSEALEKVSATKSRNDFQFTDGMKQALIALAPIATDMIFNKGDNLEGATKVSGSYLLNDENQKRKERSELAKVKAKTSGSGKAKGFTPVGNGNGAFNKDTGEVTRTNYKAPPKSSIQKVYNSKTNRNELFETTLGSVHGREAARKVSTPNSKWGPADQYGKKTLHVKGSDGIYYPTQQNIQTKTQAPVHEYINSQTGKKETFQATPEQYRSVGSSKKAYDSRVKKYKEKKFDTAISSQMLDYSENNLGDKLAVMSLVKQIESRLSDEDRKYYTRNTGAYNSGYEFLSQEYRGKFNDRLIADAKEVLLGSLRSYQGEIMNEAVEEAQSLATRLGVNFDYALKSISPSTYEEIKRREKEIQSRSAKIKEMTPEMQGAYEEYQRTGDKEIEAILKQEGVI